MKRDPDTDFLRAWLEETEGGPPDPVEGTSRAMSHLDETTQASRWLPFPMFYRGARASARPPDVFHTTDYQPSPSPATNGRTPTVIGRTQSMLSPVKAISAGAIVFAIGGAMLIAQPFQQDGGLPGAATDEPAPPVAVTATNYPGGCPGVETTETIGIIERTTGGYCNPTWDWSDDRLDGKVTLASNGDVYTDGSGLSIGMTAFSFENDEGAWRMRPGLSLEFPDVPEVGPEVWILDGEGAYDGLTAVLVVDGFEPHGFIIDGDLPPAPENASTK